jgi:hypothetical protein
MLPNILCSHICHCVALWLVNEWKILSIASNMQLSMWLYMPHGVFLQLIVFCHLSKQLQSLQSHVFIMTKILYFVIKISVIYFQICFCDRKIWKTTTESKIKNEITKLNIEYFDHVKNSEFQSIDSHTDLPIFSSVKCFITICELLVY